jgi:hypothetical protein
MCLWTATTGLLFISQVIQEYIETRWNDTDRGRRRTLRKTCPSANFSTTNTTWTDQDANKGLRGGSRVIHLFSTYVGPVSETFKLRLINLAVDVIGDNFAWTQQWTLGSISLEVEEYLDLLSNCYLRKKDFNKILTEQPTN